jgi:hypothetical protein
MQPLVGFFSSLHRDDLTQGGKDRVLLRGGAEHGSGGAEEFLIDVYAHLRHLRPPGPHGYLDASMVSRRFGMSSTDYTR